MRKQSSKRAGLVSVVLPFFNGARYIVDALDSVASQTYVNVELIVVDDGSEEIETSRLRAALATSPFKVVYIRQENRGIAAAYNTGIANARGEYVSFIEQDDVWFAEKLAADVAYLDAHPPTGMVYSRYCIGDANGRYSYDVTSQLAVSGSCFAELFCLTLSGPTILPFTAVTARAALLRKLSPLDESLRISVDYSTWLRAAFDGPIGFIDTPAFMYRVHAGNSSRNAVHALEDDRRIIEHWAARKDAVQLIGMNAIHARLMRVYEDLAFIYASSGNARMERRTLLSQLRLRPIWPQAWLQFALTLAPARSRPAVIWYVSRIADWAKRAMSSMRVSAKDGDGG